MKLSLKKIQLVSNKSKDVSDCFTLVKAKIRRYLSGTIVETDYADDMALLTNAPAQAESLPHSLEQAAGSIGLYVNADETEFICFYQRGNITRNGRFLKFVDKFTYLGSSVWSTKNDINTQLGKAWTAIN